MSEKELYSNKEILRQISDKLNDHVNSTHLYREAMAKDMAEVKSYCANSKEKVDIHDAKISKLTNAHNWMKGVIWLLTILGLGGVAKYFTT